MKKIILGMVLVALLMTVGVFGFIAYNVISGDNRIEFSSSQNASQEKSHKDSNRSTQTSESNHSKGNPPKIDVQTTQFSLDFMNSDVRNEFNGVALGMSRESIESEFGKSDGDVAVGQSNAKRYGDLAVAYDSDDKVKNIYVAPSKISVEEFKSLHGTPTIDDNDGLVYDDNPNNDFSILITTENGEIKTIENVDQIPRGSEN
ncbi:hypothetical protein [Mammaliicoccus vitulinus]|uniref:hypothetical protein n=1 Tax=Mammaliicoccus vitulinus TaxID=71237 RepID=UPI000D1D56FA|nr:hypothetical protein [Mammaliicoccus vitulinus]PTI37999.1 hypothetical protein BU074_03190 [Mammaliicoccus vitulinus]PTI90555.1 hypothetical protein BU071_02415 [Mammaliicoccus vitulinus]